MCSENKEVNSKVKYEKYDKRKLENIGNMQFLAFGKLNIYRRLHLYNLIFI